MNEDQNMFAEMLGIKRQASGTATHVARSVDRVAVAEENFVDELDVQKEVVEEMAQEKAVLEERCCQLEAEKKALEERVAVLEGELSLVQAALDARDEANPELAAVRAENAALEVKLTRMGRALIAARRAAAEASKVEIGGRRW